MLTAVVYGAAFVYLSPCLIPADVVVQRRPHAREERRELFRIFDSVYSIIVFILSAFGIEVVFLLVFYAGRRRRVLSAEKQRLVAVLVAV